MCRLLCERGRRDATRRAPRSSTASFAVTPGLGLTVWHSRMVERIKMLSSLKLEEFISKFIFSYCFCWSFHTPCRVKPTACDGSCCAPAQPSSGGQMTSEWHGSVENCHLFFRYAAVLNKLPKFWDKNEKDFFLCFIQRSY